MAEQQLTTCIAGSFKFKQEIDALHEDFADHHVTVLEPAKGWLYIPSRALITPDPFRPLPNERGLNATQVEEQFLDALRRADFLYLFNKYQYIGNMAAFEVGFANGMKKPIFAAEVFNLANFEYELPKYDYWSDSIEVANPGEAARLFRDNY